MYSLHPADDTRPYAPGPTYPAVRTRLPHHPTTPLPTLFFLPLFYAPTITHLSTQPPTTLPSRSSQTRARQLLNAFLQPSHSVPRPVPCEGSMSLLHLASPSFRRPEQPAVRTWLNTPGRIRLAVHIEPRTHGNTQDGTGDGAQDLGRDAGHETGRGTGRVHTAS